MSRLIQVFLNFETNLISNQINRLVKNLLAFILCTHISACMFWSVSCAYLSPKSWLVKEKLFFDINGDKIGFFTQYMNILVSAQAGLVLHGRETHVEAETLYEIFETLLAAIVYGSIFGNLASIIKNLDKETILQDLEKSHKFSIGRMREFMAKKKFAPELQDKILAHVGHSFVSLSGMNEASLFDDLPRTVRMDISNFLYLDLVKYFLII